MQTDVLHLDFAKAFDSIDHAIVLGKLSGYGVTGPVLCWFADYSNVKMQRVAVDGVALTWSPVTSGVPQGGILGPLLFVILLGPLLLSNNKASFQPHRMLFGYISHDQDVFKMPASTS